MKKTALLALLLLATLTAAQTQTKKKAAKTGDIVFEKTEIEIPSFPKTDPVHTVTFKFQNKGKGKLVINNVATSCGCTVADYPKHYVKPGGKGEIKVTYSGRGKHTGTFKKSITVTTNSGATTTRLYISGYMYDDTSGPNQKADEPD